MTTCICRKCGKRNIFPDGIFPETYGWTEIEWDGWYCFECEPEYKKETNGEKDKTKGGEE